MAAIVAVDHMLVLEGVRLELDRVRFLWKGEPAGQEFNRAERAELRIRYDDAESGFLAGELEFDVWRQEWPGDPWELVPPEQSVLERKVEADLLSFTRYALAIGRWPTSRPGWAATSGLGML